MFTTIRVKSLIALFALGVSMFACHISADDIREWKGTKGVTVRATFVSIKGEHVYLRLESGQEVQALIENLSSEDQAYIIEKSYEARDIEVTYAKERSGCYRESGVSLAALFRDTITFKTIEPQMDGSFKTTGDSRWLLKKIVVVEKEMGAVNKELGEQRLVSEGKFVLVNYSVENDSSLPATPPPPLLIDQRDRKYLPLDNYRTSPFIPRGALQPEKDIIQPGFKKQFCSVYEVPLTCEVEALEIFPTKVAGYTIRQFEVEIVTGRIERLSLQSAEISQNYYYYYNGSSSTRTSAKLAGVIIQVWRGNEILAGYSSLNQWNKHIKSTGIVEEMGELRRSQFDQD